MPANFTEDTYLEKICFDKLNLLTINIQDPAEYVDRLIYELDTIRKLNFSGYFLVVKDYIDEARNREDGGTGIGLSIVRAIMNNYGNEYGVLNRENGVEFYFDLELKIEE